MVSGSSRKPKLGWMPQYRVCFRNGRVFRNLDGVRAAVAEFVEQYNQSWRLEKLGYQTPIEARERYELRHAA